MKPAKASTIKERLLEALNFYGPSVTLDGIELKMITDASSKVTDLLSHVEGEEIDWQSLLDEDAELSLQYVDDSVPMTVGEFLDATREIVDALAHEKNFTDGSLRTAKRFVQLVNCADLLSYRRLSLGNINVHCGNGVTATVSSGFSMFALAMMAKGRHLFNELNPPCSENEDFFIEMCWDTLKPSVEEQEEYIEAVIFALHEELRIDVHRTGRGDVREDDEDVEFPTNKIVRPLMTGKGMMQLLTTYNKSHEPGSPEFELLQIAKTIEFVSASVIRKQAHQEIRKRLNSPDVLRPSAEYITGLINLMSQQQQSARSDAESFVRTIIQCCDAEALAPLAPQRAEQLRALVDARGPRRAKEQEKREAALQEFANVLYSTRCQFAHEKANYVVKGTECPEEQLGDLIECARLAARQCIRWYNDLHPLDRMT